MDENRLKAFEDMLAAIRRQCGDTTEKMAELSYYRAYGLVDVEKK